MANRHLGIVRIDPSIFNLTGHTLLRVSVDGNYADPSIQLVFEGPDMPECPEDQMIAWVDLKWSPEKGFHV